MIRTLVADLRGHVGGTVTVAGWVQTLRLQRARTWTPTANAGSAHTRSCSASRAG